MRQALRLILAAAVVLLGLFAQPAASASVDSFAAADVPVYNYDGHPVPIDADGVLSGRGPPAITDDRIAYPLPVDAASSAPSSSRQPAATLTGTTYDHVLRSAQRDNGWATTRPAADALRGDSRPDSAVRVAAKTVGPNAAEGFGSFSAAKRALGSLGKGNVYDHVVEQSQIGRSGFAPELIHNAYNMKPVPGWVNQVKANYYSRKFDWTNGGTVRDWLSGQSYDAQYQFGLRVLDDVQAGVIR
ncbi:MAG: hypothetical protein KBB39_14090 [Phycicoccus sp.]|nr:hypothetical protein [Phycicoccus sp.]